MPSFAIVLNADQHGSDLLRQVADVRRIAGDRLGAVRLVGPSPAVKVALDQVTRAINGAGVDLAAFDSDESNLGRQLPQGSRCVAYLPPGAACVTLPLQGFEHPADRIMPWPVSASLPAQSCNEPESHVAGWIMSSSLADKVSTDPLGRGLPLAELADTLDRLPDGVDWLSGRLDRSGVDLSPASSEPLLKQDSRILAIVPHYECQVWLPGALRSLVRQTRPLDGVVVIDDASKEPPLEICRRYPEVSLYRSAENVGPYRLVQRVVDQTDFDGYMFQDADDWSAVDRLELLLSGAERSGAALIGSQEMRVNMEGVFQPATYPLDVNRAMSQCMTHPLLHPTSLVAKSLVREIGGFATGLRFAGDTEFLYRAVFAARSANVQSFSFYRRVRNGSLTMSRETGNGSEARQSLLRELREQGNRNLRHRQDGYDVDLRPRCQSPAPRLIHLAGPRLF